MDECKIAPVAELPGRTDIPQRTLEPYVAQSNFDELTPEEQEHVRERMVRFFISIITHE